MLSNQIHERLYVSIAYFKRSRIIDERSKQTLYMLRVRNESSLKKCTCTYIHTYIHTPGLEPRVHSGPDRGF